MTVAEQPEVRRRPAFAFGPGHLLAIAGGIAVIVSIFLNWEDLTVAGHHSTAKARDVPVKFLFDYTTRSKDPSFVLLLAIIAAVILVGVLLGGRLVGGRFLVLIGALLAIAVAVVFSFQVHQALNALHVAKAISVTDFVGPAPYVAFAGGVLALIGSFIRTPVDRAAV
ncbi:MAG TPA: hypothetical protein VLV81_13485 [Acidimicrobiia bacterium]|nr:hypothetical protein [Acidimicrobiia bacterium]